MVREGGFEMSLQAIILSAASVIIGIAFFATVSTETFARDAGLVRLDHSRHHHQPAHHGGRVHRGRPTAQQAPAPLLRTETMQVSDGCGQHRHRNRSGHCVPNRRGFMK
jgi:hypothetical protein